MVSSSPKIISLAMKGKKWEDDEVVKLLASVQKKKSFYQIAEEHQRTLGGITSQLKKMAYEYYEEGRNMEEIIKFTGLTQEDIDDSIKRYNYRKEISLQKKEVSKFKHINDLSGDIKTLADIIEKKKFIISQNMYSVSTPLAKVYDQEKVDILVPIIKILKDIQDRLAALEKINE